MAEDFVEDVRFLDVVEMLALADERGGREGAFGQHREEPAERDEGRDRLDPPACFPGQDRRDIDALRHAVMRQVELSQSGEIRPCHMPLDRRQLTLEEVAPDGILLGVIGDETLRIRHLRLVFGGFGHVASSTKIMALKIVPRSVGISSLSCGDIA